MGTTEEVVDDGPWRATRLWNSIIRNLQDGIPQKRHRRQLKTYEKCFTGIEATEWLHKHLKKNPNFDAEVTKEQTVRLLQKLVRAGVIVPVKLDSAQPSGTLQQYAQPCANSGGDAQILKSDTEFQTFRSNSDLYRLASEAVEQLRTPGKDSSSARKFRKKGEDIANINSGHQRTPLTQIRNKQNDTVGVESAIVSSPASGFRSSFRRNKNKLKKKALDFKENENDQGNSDAMEVNEQKCYDDNGKYSVDQRKHLNLSYIQSLPPNSLVVLDNDSTWSEIFTTQLKLTLSDVHVRGLNVNTTNIIYNMTNVSPKGVVQLKSVVTNTSSNNQNVIYQQQDLPHWTLSAMKCLANWPKQIKTSPTGNDADGTNFPSYHGFEQDVFEVVKDYFVGQMNKQGPLTTYKLFDIFVSAYIKAEAIGARTKAFKRPASQNNWITNKNVLRHPEDHYVETDLDSGCYVQTSTPSSSVGTQPSYGMKGQFPDIAPATFFKMASSPYANEADYGISTTNLKRVAKIRQTYEICPNQQITQERRNSQLGYNSKRHTRSTTNSSVSLSPEMSATAIMRNFLPPNTCFETAFMNECPITRIVPQKGSETLHHLQPNPYSTCAKEQRLNHSKGKLKCYTPIPSGASVITASAWDTRSIATQTEDEDEEKMPLVSVGKEEKPRSRQPRWKRSVKKRKSIAVMETNATKSASGVPASPAKSESAISMGVINRGFSMSPLRRKDAQPTAVIPRQRSASTLPYNSIQHTLSPIPTPTEQFYSNSLDNLLSSRNNQQGQLNEGQNHNFPQQFDQRYSMFVSNFTEMSGQNIRQVPAASTKAHGNSPSENMIRSKTVRAEKRKQRDRRERSVDRLVDNNRSNQHLNHEGQHIHPSMQSLRPHSMATFDNRYCYVNPIPVCDQNPQKAILGCPQFNTNGNYISPNASKSSASSLTGSASTYQYRPNSMRPVPASHTTSHNTQHHLFHHQNGLSVKTPLRSCPSLMETATIPFMDDSDMLYARAEPYQPSLSSELGIECDNSKIMSKEGVSSAIASFQLLGLLLPPANRRKLQLLLKFMRRLASKEKLKIVISGGLGIGRHGEGRSCRDAVLDTFTETIIKPNQDYSNGDMELSRKIVQFFMDHYEAVWTPPTALRKEVEERVSVKLSFKAF